MYRTFGLIIVLGLLIAVGFYQSFKQEQFVEVNKKAYWFEMHRKSNAEYLYFGEPGVKELSALVKIFKVKPGIPGKRPTPLPELLGREYWRVTGKMEVFDNAETAPYFITLDVPLSSEPPFGPAPYLECNGQCDWVLPGAFGLHGVNGDASRLSNENPGSSGCVRHSDEDITFLYKLLDPVNSEIRYYVYDV